MKSRNLRNFLSLAALVALGSAAGLAQMQSQLTGTVTDKSGAVIVGAAVTARNVGTGAAYTAVTSPSGTYVVPLLPPGQYEIFCELAGFKKSVRSGVVLETGTTTTLDIQLEVGAITETVTVRAAAPLLETESSSVGQLVERASVVNMPVESRRSGSLVRLMGMVAFSSETLPEQVPTFSIAGGRSKNQMWLLDGVVTQNESLGTMQLSLNPPSESLQEFKVEANNYSAELGRNFGGIILMTTRSGTNSFHGAVYEFVRNDKFDARPFFAPRKPELRYNIFGGSLGGPIRRNKTFFFVNYEGARRRDGSAQTAIVPRPAEVNGDFSARRDVRIINPMTRQPFDNNIIPQALMDPVGKKLAALYPAPNRPDDVTRAPGVNYVTNVVDAVTQDFVTARMDHNLTDRDRISGRYSYVRAPLRVGPIFPDAFADFRGNFRGNSHNQWTASWIHNFRANLLNEFRFLYGTRLFQNQALGTGSGKNGELGLRGVDATAFPTVTVGGHQSLGFNTHYRLQAPIVNQHYIDHVTWIRGKHDIKTGFEWRHSGDTDDFRQFSGGSFDFSSRATNEGLATLLLGWTTSGRLVVTDILNGRTDYFGAFIQDSWKVTPRLTLNLGLRWEGDTPRHDANDRQSGFDFKAINPVAAVPGVVTFAGRDGRSRSAHDFDSNNFGPRVGFAYRLRDKMVLRAGFGIAYNGAYTVSVTRALFNGFSLNGSFSSPDGGLTPAFLLRDGMPAVGRDDLGPGFGAVRVGDPVRTSPDFFLQNHTNAHAQQWNFEIQRELPGNSMLELSYLGNAAHKVGGQDVSLNQIPLVNGRGPAAQNQRLRPFPQFNDVVEKSPPWGNSNYHAMNVKLEKRYSGGLNVLMNYTWSKFIDDVQANSELNDPAAGNAQGAGYTHIELRKFDRALSGNDIRHRFISSAVYELPFGRGRHWNISNPALNHIAGGWGLGAIAEFRSGAPYGVIELTNLSNTFSAAQRPNLLHRPEISHSSRGDLVAHYFDTSAFQAPGAGVFGNAARNVGIGPGYVGVDMSVHKRWPLREQLGLQFRTDFYNLSNRPNFAEPGNVRGRGDFGQIGSVLLGSNGRLIQFSLRLEF